MSASLEPCRFRWNGDDHTWCPRCGGTNVDPIQINQPAHPTEYERFCAARQAMNQAVIDWISTYPPHKDVVDEVAATVNIVIQLGDLQPTGE